MNVRGRTLRWGPWLRSWNCKGDCFLSSALFSWGRVPCIVKRHLSQRCQPKCKIVFNEIKPLSEGVHQHPLLHTYIHTYIYHHPSTNPSIGEGTPPLAGLHPWDPYPPFFKKNEILFFQVKSTYATSFSSPPLQAHISPRPVFTNIQTWFEKKMRKNKRRYVDR